ncbi:MULTISPECIES: carbohydrate deacetylase [unclassified Paenibacillus]|uniref:carbohydrate deacetylase n=1 Tax=unclassified Paenibacillus TaxID=185978 RepID=UPI000838682A|nr:MULTISPECIES: carbohydrate deacetylase [unclassified Paenibacillus]NWL89354.1 carbohydrate deacetylase [Paenibacillus sp. 79R4]
MNRQVIINADDFGMSAGVNRGIIDAFNAGGITSTSLMVNMPGFPEAVQLAHQYPDLSVGLHFNLTMGRPVSDPASIPSLVKEDGTFRSGAAPQGWDWRDVHKELAAQWDRFTSTGLRPTHLDSHHLLHQDHAEIYKVMARKAYNEGVPLRRSQVAHPLSGVPAPKMTDFIMLDTYGDDKGRERLRQHLLSLRGGITEIMCHPGYEDEVLMEPSPWADIRKQELALFTSPEVANTLAAIGVSPINYRVLQRRKPSARSRARYRSKSARTRRLLPSQPYAVLQRQSREKRKRSINEKKVPFRYNK